MMLKVVTVALLCCAVEARLRKPSVDAAKIEAIEKKEAPLFKKVSDEMRLVAKELQKGETNKTAAKDALKTAVSTVSEVKKEMEAVKKELETVVKTVKAPKESKNVSKDEKFPWWAANASSLPNLTQVKTEKAPKGSKNASKDEKFPYWADAMPNLTQVKTDKAPKAFKNVSKDKNMPAPPSWNDIITDIMPNLTQVKTDKAPKASKNDTVGKKFPYWADAMPNLTQVKTENATEESKVAAKDKKFPYWADAMPNFTQVKKEKAPHLVKNQTKSPTFASLGPFASKEAACDYCFTSHTRSSVVENCVCTAYDADDGPTMFCTASAPGMKYVASQPGGCQCVEKNPSAMGKTTCDPL